jgi:hypothetical protein
MNFKRHEVGPAKRSASRMCSHEVSESDSDVSYERADLCATVRMEWEGRSGVAYLKFANQPPIEGSHKPR